MVTPEAPVEINYGESYAPWTEEELTQAILDIRSKWEENLSDPLNNDLNYDNPLVDNDVEIAKRYFRLGGVDHECMLFYRKYNEINSDEQFVPFPDDSSLQIEFPFGESPRVYQFPMALRVGTVEPLPGNLSYRLAMDGMETVDGIFTTEGDGSLIDAGVVIDSIVKEAILPSDPRRVSSINFTFQPPKP